MNYLSIFFVLIFLNLNAYSQEAGSLEDLNRTFKQYPDTPSLLEKSALKYLAVKSAYEYADTKWYLFKPNKEERATYARRAEADYYYTKCKNEKVDCAKLQNLLNVYPHIKEYLKIIDIPKVNGKDGTFTTADGNVYSSKTGKVVRKVAKKSSSELSSEQNVSGTNKKNQDTQSKKTSSDVGYNDDDSVLKCKWSNVFPRKIIRGPGCKSEGDKICIGYITCTAGKIKIDRLAICSQNLCGESDAADCAKQPGYGSADVATTKNNTGSSNNKSVKSNQ